MDRIVEIEKIQLDESVESSLRPSSFEDYVGQEKIKSNLAIAIAGLRRWISSMKSTSPLCRFVKIAARSPAFSIIGAAVTLMAAPI